LKTRKMGLSNVFGGQSGLNVNISYMKKKRAGGGKRPH